MSNHFSSPEPLNPGAMDPFELTVRRPSPPPDGRPRVLAVVDGGDPSMRSLSWAIGYAAARGSAAIAVVPFVRSWERLRSAGQTSPYSTTLPGLDLVSAREEVCALVSETCREAGISPRLVAGRPSSTRELRDLLQREQPDAVVLCRSSGLSWIATRRLVSRLTSSGIPVIVIP